MHVGDRLAAQPSIYRCRVGLQLYIETVFFKKIVYLSEFQ